MRRLADARGNRLLFDRGTGGQPAAQRLVFSVCQTGHRQRHALLRVGCGIGTEFARQRADVLAIEAQRDLIGDFAVGRQRRAAPQIEHARHQRRLTALSFQYRIEAFTAPCISVARIVKQPGGRNRFATLPLIDRNLARATAQPFPAAQIQLARRVIAGVAGNALLGKDWLNVLNIGNSRWR